MKDFIRTKVESNTGQVLDINDFLGEDENLKILWEECCNKDKIINILFENHERFL